MTKEELGKVPFEFIAHWNLDKQYVSVYRNDEYGIEVHKVTKKKDGFATGRGRNIYFYKDGKYKSVDKLLEAMNIL